MTSGLNFRKTLMLAAAGAAFALPLQLQAHCGPAHRHFQNRVYYITYHQYQPPVWCDDCGTVWSYGDVEVDRYWRGVRVNPLVDAPAAEITTARRQTVRERTLEK